MSLAGLCPPALLWWEQLWGHSWRLCTPQTWSVCVGHDIVSDCINHTTWVVLLKPSSTEPIYSLLISVCQLWATVMNSESEKISTKLASIKIHCTLIVECWLLISLTFSSLFLGVQAKLTRLTLKSPLAINARIQQILEKIQANWTMKKRCEPERKCGCSHLGGHRRKERGGKTNLKWIIYDITDTAVNFPSPKEVICEWATPTAESHDMNMKSISRNRVHNSN